MKNLLHIISILACLSLAALGAKGQVKNVPTLHRTDSVKPQLNIRSCWGNTVYYIDGVKIESKDLPPPVHEDFSTHCVFAKDQDPFAMADGPQFIMVSGSNYTRWELKEFGPWHFPGI